MYKRQDDAVLKVMLALTAGGHILIDDIPGVGKTTMAMGFAKAMGYRCNRIQFTPDVMPSDIVGFSAYNPKTQEFEYREGAAMCNLLLADEINSCLLYTSYSPAQTPSYHCRMQLRCPLPQRNPPDMPPYHSHS